MKTLERTAARTDLAEFLRSRRSRLSPLDVGLAAGPRRRTPGLRREEVAQLAGVGITWYTWFEQGRDIRVSTHFLENLARALRLDSTERAHLFALAQHRPPPLEPASAPTVSQALQRMIDGLAVPAYVKTARWDVIAWNRAAALLFGDYAAIPPERRNILWLVFTEPSYRAMMVDWEGDARRVLAKFRVDFGRAAGDPHFTRLVAELDEASPEFHLWWRRHDVLGRGEGVKMFRHGKIGELEFEHTAFAVEGTPDLRMVVYTPSPGESEARMHRLMRGASDRPSGVQRRSNR